MNKKIMSALLAMGISCFACTGFAEAKAIDYQCFCNCGNCINQQQESKSDTLVQNDYALQVLKLVNAERARYGLSPLKLSLDLQRSAAIRADEIVRVFSHDRPDGSSCFTAFPNENCYKGENIAAGQDSPEEVMDSWMNSQGHRENILSAKYKELGVGYCYSQNSTYGHYWVQLFKG